MKTQLQGTPGTKKTHTHIHTMYQHQFYFVMYVIKYLGQNGLTFSCIYICREFKVTNNSVDIGIKSAAGLRPKMLKQQEIQPDPESK